MLIATCDDEVQFCKQVELYIKGLGKELGIETKCDKYISGEDLLASDYNKYQIIFLDIELKNENGIDIAEKIRKTNENVEIIFLTAFIQYAVDGYKVKAYRFLVKPVNYDDFVFQLNELFIRINNYEKSNLLLTKEGQKYNIKIQDIIYIEVMDHNLTYHCANCEITVVGTMKKMEKSLNEHYFVRIHNSFMINMKYIAEVRSHTILLKNMVELPVTRSKKEMFRRAYLEFWGDELG